MVAKNFSITDGLDVGIGGTILTTKSSDNLLYFNSNFTQVGILTGSLSETGDAFGYSLASSSDGSIVIAGAPFDEAVGAASSSGVVYVFSSNNQIGIITGSNVGKNNPQTASDYEKFGNSVACNFDATTIVVGCPRIRNNDSSGVFRSYGAVYIFDRVGDTFTQVGILTSNVPLGGYSQIDFGLSVACSSDGKTIAITEGNYGTSGRLFVFDRVDNNFNLVGVATIGSGQFYSNSGSERFGNSLAISGDGTKFIVGASGVSVTPILSGLVFIYKRVGNQLNREYILEGRFIPGYQTSDFDKFGASVSCNSLGNKIAVGVPFVLSESGNVHGAVYLFITTIISGQISYVLDGVLYGSTLRPYSAFGNSVAYSADGKYVAVGSKDDRLFGKYGLAYVYDAIFKQERSIVSKYSDFSSYDNFGSSVFLSSDASRLIVADDRMSSISNAGTVHIFDNIAKGYYSAYIGIGSTNPSSKLSVVGDANISGIITAAKFDGDGKQITNNTGIYTGIIVSNDSSKVIAAASTINFISTQFDIKFNSGITTVSHNLKNSIYTLNGITGYSNITNQAISVGNINSSGIITANFFQGTGSEIRNIPGTLLEPYSNNSDISHSTFSLTISDSLFPDKNGNIGIGTTNSTSKLTVLGDGRFTGVVTALDGYNVGITSSGTTISTNSVKTFNFENFDNILYNNKTSNITLLNNAFITGGELIGIRTSVEGTTSSIGIGSAENLTLSVSKSYILHKVGVSTAAWVRLYTDQTSRTSDASRSEITEPSSGSGVIAEVITTGISTVLMTPGVIGFNNDDPDTSNVYLAVTNKGTSTQAITVTLNYVPIQGTP